MGRRVAHYAFLEVELAGFSEILDEGYKSMDRAKDKFIVLPQAPGEMGSSSDEGGRI